MDTNSLGLNTENSQMEFPEVPDRRWYRPDGEYYQGIATSKGYDQSNSRLKRLHYTHDAMIDYIIANPGCQQSEIAAEFGYTEPWVSRVLGSDAFQAALYARRDSLTDPTLIATLDEKLQGLAHQSLEILTRKLAPENNPGADLALKVAELATKSLGFGARSPNQGVVNNNFVVNLPPKSEDSASWSQNYAPPMLQARELKPMSSTIDRDPTIPLAPAKTLEND